MAELTVEQCLQELREMFGDGPYIRVTWQESMTNWSRNGPERSAGIQIGNWYSSREPTLEDAMALTRRSWEGHQWLKPCQEQEHKQS